MTQLSEHFTLEEFIHPGTVVPDDVLAKLTKIASILEKVRLQFNQPVHIDSGYRTAEQNKAVGGVPTSYHCFTGDQSAVDFRVEGCTLQGVFDWLRLKSTIPFDKAILERKQGAVYDEGGCIHLQFNSAPRRLAYLGQTHGTGGYVKVDSVALPQFPVASEG
jgi:hypothetical protein